MKEEKSTFTVNRVYDKVRVSIDTPDTLVQFDFTLEQAGQTAVRMLNLIGLVALISPAFETKPKKGKKK